MSKLYVFGIGGTGSRVIKSLTYLLAAGVHCKASEVIPIIMDPDESNADLSRTISAMQSYKKLRDELSFGANTQNQFFRTPIKTVQDKGVYLINLKSTSKKFEEYINYNSLDKNNAALISALFSKSNLESNMQVGFKGNPNMGSVVMNEFHTTQEYQDFAASFQQGDRIFIISSIFGGTGASGFPLLLKNLRDPSGNLANASLIKDADIGAISVLPYFNVKDNPAGTVDSRTFMSKARAALMYYMQDIGNDINTMYYIGDDKNKTYEHQEGSVGQRNDAHFIELMSALSIIDFANSGPAGNAGNVKEFGIKNDSGSVVFDNLYDATKNQIYKPLTQYLLTTLFLKNEASNRFAAPFAVEVKLNSDELSSSFFKNWIDFNGSFKEWLVEMERNDRGFSPFDLNEEEKIFDIVKGIPLKNGIFKRNYERYVEFLNKNIRNVKGDNPATKFMEINYLATQQMVQK